MKKKEPKPETIKTDTPPAAPSGGPPQPAPDDVKPLPTTPLDTICRAIPEEEAKKIQSELDAVKKSIQERDEFLNLLQRVKADFDNYQKRVRQDKECWLKYQDESILREILPALDNLDHSLKVKCESADAKCILDGVILTKREIRRVLEKRGVQMIKTVGAKFDPYFHEALMTVESAEHPPGVILEELRTGYLLHDRVIRPAQVKLVITPKSSDKTTPTPTNGTRKRLTTDPPASG